MDFTNKFNQQSNQVNFANENKQTFPPSYPQMPLQYYPYAIDPLTASTLNNNLHLSNMIKSIDERITQLDKKMETSNKQYDLILKHFDQVNDRLSALFQLNSMNKNTTQKNIPIHETTQNNSQSSNQPKINEQKRNPRTKENKKPKEKPHFNSMFLNGEDPFESMIVQIEDIKYPKSKKEPDFKKDPDFMNVLGPNIFGSLMGILGSSGKKMRDNKLKAENNIIEDEIDEEYERMIEEENKLEFEEIDDISLESLDDLIKVGTSYNRIKDKKVSDFLGTIKHEIMKINTCGELQKFLLELKGLENESVSTLVKELRDECNKIDSLQGDKELSLNIYKIILEKLNQIRDLIYEDIGDEPINNLCKDIEYILEEGDIDATNDLYSNVVDEKEKKEKKEINNENESDIDRFMNNLEKDLKSNKTFIPPPIFIKGKFGSTEKHNLSELPINSEPVSKKEQVTKTYFMYNNKRYSLDFSALGKLEKPLRKLKGMVGMKEIKESIVDMILYYLQGFESRNRNMLHTRIEGPPGVGKTEVGKIMAEIYCAMGVIPSNKFKLVKRTDLMGEYLGHTAIKTQNAIDEADGGVLFIDEAYSLGHKEKRDSYSKECIDVLNQNLSENKKKLIVIIAGYPGELQECFFSMNPGLERRFPFRYVIEKYSPDEMKQIFWKKVSDIKWDIKDVDDKMLTQFFSENKEVFKYYGGDIENFLLSCKLVHSRRTVGKHPNKRRHLNDDDLKKGLERFLANRKKEEEIPMSIQKMFM